MLDQSNGSSAAVAADEQIGLDRALIVIFKRQIHTESKQ